MLTVYITPNLAFTTNKVKNPYVTDLADAMQKQGATVIRSTYASILHTLDILLYAQNIDLLLLNWPEDIITKRLGRLQIWLLKKAVKIIQNSGGRVAWTMHNKLSHHHDLIEEKKAITAWLQASSDLIIIHSQEGIGLVNEPNKVFYFPHPFRSILPQAAHLIPCSYDVIIWGRIAPYKGLHLFLSYLYDAGLQNQYRILICGQCIDNEYWEKLKQFQNANIILLNKFLTDSELGSYVNESKTILFTHAGDSVLTSGTVAESLRYGKTVIAPNRANFTDLAKEGVVYTYNSYVEAVSYIETCCKEPVSQLVPYTKIQAVIDKYSWDAYSAALLQHVKKIDQHELSTEYSADYIHS